MVTMEIIIEQTDSVTERVRATEEERKEGREKDKGRGGEKENHGG